jgi:hypothetical protein
VTGKNWEVIGVAPDIAVRAADSLRTAHLLALKAISKKADANKRRALEEIVRKFEGKPDGAR